MKKIKLIAVTSAVVLTAVACSLFTGCQPESERVNYNISQEAENFNVYRRVTVINCIKGDTVYMIIGRTEKVRRKKVTEHIIVKCGVDNFRIGDAGYPSVALCDTDNNWYYGIEPSNFGDFVFLTREEAEQALKEREKE